MSRRRGLGPLRSDRTNGGLLPPCSEAEKPSGTEKERALLPAYIGGNLDTIEKVFVGLFVVGVVSIGYSLYHNYDIEQQIGKSQCKIVGVQNQLFGGIEKVTKTAYLCGDSLYWR